MSHTGLAWLRSAWLYRLPSGLTEPAASRAVRCTTAPAPLVREICRNEASGLAPQRTLQALPWHTQREHTYTPEDEQRASERLSVVCVVPVFGLEGNLPWQRQAAMAKHAGGFGDLPAWIRCPRGVAIWPTQRCVCSRSGAVVCSACASCDPIRPSGAQIQQRLQAKRRSLAMIEWIGVGANRARCKSAIARRTGLTLANCELCGVARSAGREMTVGRRGLQVIELAVAMS
jgi:hypothetical protein